KNLRIETVGDLLRHFPRRYIKTGELTRVQDLQVGQMLTVVGEISESKVATYTDRRSGKLAYRLETVLLTGGPRLRMTFFAKNAGTSKWQAGRLPVGRKGLFIGQAGQFGNQWQLTNPTMVLFGGPGDEEEMITPDQLRGLYPLYPLTKGVDH